MDYTFNSINQHSLPLAPLQAMQFGATFHCLVQRLVPADPKYGPPLLMKVDLADEYYRIPLSLAVAFLWAGNIAHLSSVHIRRQSRTQQTAHVIYRICHTTWNRQRRRRPTHFWRFPLYHSLQLLQQSSDLIPCFRLEQSSNHQRCHALKHNDSCLSYFYYPI
jgi:hypothetical protein